MMTTVSRLENSWRIYSDIQRQIRYADRKVQILLAIGLAILSFSLTRVETIGTIPLIIRYPFSITLFVSALFFLLSVLMALFARGAVSIENRIPHFTFFGHISQYKNAAAYAESTQKASLKELLNDLHQQIYQISHIALEKYKYYRRAWIALLGVILSLLFLLLGQLF